MVGAVSLLASITLIAGFVTFLDWRARRKDRQSKHRSAV